MPVLGRYHPIKSVRFSGKVIIELVADEAAALRECLSHNGQQQPSTFRILDIHPLKFRHQHGIRFRQAVYDLFCPIKIFSGKFSP